MAETLKLRNQPDVMLSTFFEHSFNLFGADGVTLAQLRMRLVLVSVVDLADDDINAHLRQPAHYAGQLPDGSLIANAQVHTPPGLFAGLRCL